MSSQDLDLAASVAQVLSVLIPAFVGFLAWKRALDRRDAEQVKQIALVQQKLDFIERQFGPNGGGLREAVNRLSASVVTIDKRLLDLTKEHSELIGHIRSCPAVINWEKK